MTTIEDPLASTPDELFKMDRRRSDDLERFIGSLDRERPIAILTQDNPDPDAIAGALGLRKLLHHVQPDRAVEIFYGGAISHPQNRTMVNVLNLNLQEVRHLDLARRYYVFLVDATNTGEKNVQSIDVEPDAIFDHHLDVPKNTPVFVDIRPVGAVSSIVTEHLQNLHVPVDGSLASALLLGITTDTMDLTKNLTDVDIRAWRFLQPLIDRQILNDIKNYPIPSYLFDLEQDALQKKRAQGSMLVAGLGYLSPGRRDGIPHVADHLLRMEGVSTVLVFAIIEKNLQASVRSTNPSFDTKQFIQKLFGEKHSGAKTGSGGSQVPLGPISPDADTDEEAKEHYWEFVREWVTTKAFRLASAQD